ncbi:dockerin type I domain-containing protein [Desulfosarcina sp.]|uniref:dockerin type I domain-containing protein n=1 Tax=Desulfosarcina sp. TaxID=2027861 RepID=UPI00397106B8
MISKKLIFLFIVFGIVFTCVFVAYSFTAKNVGLDALVRMPGTQPDQGVVLQDPLQGQAGCINCHGENPTDPTGQFIVVPGFSWSGSMMAQAARDPIFWATMTVAAQDSIAALGRPNAVDICLRCHFPQGWLAGRSGHIDPSDLNASAMTGSDFDGVSCDLCHRMYDPFFEDTFEGTRESSAWESYWDEAGNTGPPSSTTLSQIEAEITLNEDRALASAINLFNGNDFYLDDRPVFDTYTENGGGQFFVSTTNNFVDKRASFADTVPDHSVLYSRYHKSKFFCGTCHDVSNPALENVAFIDAVPDDGTTELPSETQSAYSYFHVERTFSEFMLSAYGRGGAPTNLEFQEQGANRITYATKCQDCHMWDTVGKGCGELAAPLRPDESIEHPNSGAPFHTLQGGNAWMTFILATTDDHFPEFDPINLALLNQGKEILTLDLAQGIDTRDNGAALLAASNRALFQLKLAGTIQNIVYDPVSGDLDFRILNNSGHKLITGYPEGRRMFVNIKAYDESDNLIFEVNPYDYSVGTLRGLDPTKVPSSPALGPNEIYVDELVYESTPKSDLAGIFSDPDRESKKTFHFALATDRFKDNRIPPKGFSLADAAARLSRPVWEGVKDDGSPTDLFTPAEYAGGYDDVNLAGTVFPAGAARVEIVLYYQGTSREYVEFLRDEINGSATAPNFLTLQPANYIVQTDAFFQETMVGLRAWGNTIWDLWYHNHGLDNSGTAVPGIMPFEMAKASWPGLPACECNLNGDNRCNILDYQIFIQDWGATSCNDPNVVCECDLNNDGSCNILDYQIFTQDWGRTDCP